MPTFRFPYKRYREGTAPIIALNVLARGRWRRIFGYVDSGAAYSILTVAEAKRLGLVNIKGRSLAVTTSGGRTHQISLHRLWAKIGKKRFSITFGVPRGFDVEFNLLGRRDLFRRFAICFDDRHSILRFITHRQ